MSLCHRMSVLASICQILLIKLSAPHRAYSSAIQISDAGKILTILTSFRHSLHNSQDDGDEKTEAKGFSVSRHYVLDGKARLKRVFLLKCTHV